MYLANTAIKRPVFTVMVITALIVLGLSSFIQMNTELYPDIEFPFVVISTVYPGASPASVETDVTKKIEDAVNTIAGIKILQSYSRESYSQVVIQFTLETNPDIAAQDVRDKISGIMQDLPSDIEQPVVQKFDFASRPVITLSVSSQRPQKEITGFAKNFLKRRLETVSGVGSVEIIGGSEREIQVLLDLDKMNAMGIVPGQITSAIVSSNLELPGGKLNRGPQDINVRTVGRITSIDQLGQVIVHNSNGKIIRLSDIARVIDGVKEKQSLSRFNGKESVSLDIIRQSSANIVKVADGVLKRLNDLQNEIPEDIKVTVVQDDSQFIKQSIHDMIFDLIYGGLLAVMVIFLFLANLRSTIISAIAIPTSIISTFFLMKLFGFTINMMTLLALSLSVGLLIDDAIVVIENIYRHLDMGKSAWHAARDATQEIGLAVMATTFSIVVVFLPVAFMSGIVGRFFYQFGITVAGAVTISLFVAFTLTPMLSSRFLKKEEQIRGSKPGLINVPGNVIRWILRIWHRAFSDLNVRYKTTLHWVLRHRFVTLLIATLIFFGSLGIGGMLGKEFMPQSDQSEFYVMFTAGPDASLERTGELAKKIEDRISSYPEVAYMLTSIGGTQTPVNEGQIYVKLKPINERKRSSFEMISVAREDLRDIAGLSIVVQSGANEGGGGQAVEYSVRGPEMEVVKGLANQVEDIMREAPGGVDFQNSEKLARPEMQIHVERDLANDLGISIAGVATTVRNLIDGYVVSRFMDINQEEEYDIRSRLAPKFRNRVNDLEQIKILSTKKVQGKDLHIDLGNVAELTMSSGPTEIRRYNRQKEVRIGCNIKEGYASSDVVNYVNSNIPRLNIPAGYEVSVVGTAEIQQESFGNIFISLILAIIFIYLLLASQFESFIDPLAIMLSLPLAVVGALLALFIWHSTLNIISLIGIIMLMGLVTKNAILLVDFIKQQRRKGVERTEAILIAGPIRLRPILMTTFAMIFGMIPVALGLGEGAGFKAPMGRAVIGGLISSTMLTLVVVPVVYTILDDIVAYILGHQTVRVEAEPVANPGDDKQA